MPTVLLTGANRGIGLEFARQYAAAGWRVLATCRAPEKAEKLSALGDGVSLYELDVTDHARIKALAKELEGEAIDLLINNAGLYGASQSQELGSIDPELWIEVLRVNTLAPLKMAECFLPHLKTGERKVIASITSRMGSIGDNDVGGHYIYRSSKAALNAAVRSLAIDLKPLGVTAVVLHPGWVRTAMGGKGAAIDPEPSVAGMRAVIERLGPADAGKFLSYDGRELAW